MALRVCICDDDPLIGSLLKLSLGAAGFRVDEPIGSLPEAIAVLGSSPPDVLLLDLNMPVGGGLELLSHLRDTALLKRMQVLMLTGEDDVYFMERARSLGASGYLTKPLNLPLLIERMRRVAGDRRVRWVDDFCTVVSPGDAATPGADVQAPSADAGPLNPVVSELVSSYGKGPVEKLLRALLTQLTKFQATPRNVLALSAAAHSLKGAAGSLGFTLLFDACIDLEAACRAGEIIDGRHHAAARACKDAHRAIDTWLACAA